MAVGDEEEEDEDEEEEEEDEEEEGEDRDEDKSEDEREEVERREVDGGGVMVGADVVETGEEVVEGVAEEVEAGEVSPPYVHTPSVPSGICKARRKRRT